MPEKKDKRTPNTFSKSIKKENFDINLKYNIIYLLMSFNLPLQPYKSIGVISSESYCNYTREHRCMLATIC